MSSFEPKHFGNVYARKRRKAGIQMQITPTFSSTLDHVPLARVSYVGFVVFEYRVKVCTRRQEMVMILSELVD